MAVDDAAEARQFDDAASREAVGASRRISSPRLSEHVPIRFRPATIERVQHLANLDRKTVSGWIRDVVEREVEARLPEPETGHQYDAMLQVTGIDQPASTTGHAPDERLAS